MYTHTHTKFRSTCTGACLSERTKDDGPDTQVALLRELLRRLDLWAPSAAPTPPEVLPQTPEASPPPTHLLHGYTDKSHGCIRMNISCSVNATVNCSTFNALFKSL
jgi:hypothetical protein